MVVCDIFICTSKGQQAMYQKTSFNSVFSTTHFTIFEGFQQVGMETFDYEILFIY